MILVYADIPGGLNFEDGKDHVMKASWNWEWPQLTAGKETGTSGQQELDSANAQVNFQVDSSQESLDKYPTHRSLPLALEDPMQRYWPNLSGLLLHGNCGIGSGLLKSHLTSASLLPISRSWIYSPLRNTSPLNPSLLFMWNQMALFYLSLKKVNVRAHQNIFPKW